MSKDKDGTGDYIFEFVGRPDAAFGMYNKDNDQEAVIPLDGDFTIETWFPKIEALPQDEWVNVSLVRNGKGTTSTMHYDCELDGVKFVVAEVRDEQGLREKHFTRADLVRG